MESNPGQSKEKKERKISGTSLSGIKMSLFPQGEEPQPSKILDKGKKSQNKKRKKVVIAAASLWLEA